MMLAIQRNETTERAATHASQRTSDGLKAKGGEASELSFAESMQRTAVAGSANAAVARARNEEARGVQAKESRGRAESQSAQAKAAETRAGERSEDRAGVEDAAGNERGGGRARRAEGEKKSEAAGAARGQHRGRKAAAPAVAEAEDGVAESEATSQPDVAGGSVAELFGQDAGGVQAAVGVAGGEAVPAGVKGNDAEGAGKMAASATAAKGEVGAPAGGTAVEVAATEVAAADEGAAHGSQKEKRAGEDEASSLAAGVSKGADGAGVVAGGLGSGQAAEVRHAERAAHVAATPAATAVRGQGTEELTVHSYEASSAHRLEIGLTGGSLGWLKVRAEMGQGGEVHTVLRGSTEVAAVELRSQAVELQSYLTAQDLKVHTVTVENAQVDGWSAMANGGQGERQQQAGAERGEEQARGRDAVGADVRKDGVAMVGGWVPVPQRMGSAGGWLNVLA